MKSPQRASLMYGFSHFAVEVACFWMINSHFGDSPLWWCIAIMYDCLAFVPQLFIGMIADRFPKLKLGPAGLIAIAAALVIPMQVPAFIFLTIGNCMVHVAGAEYTLRGAEGKAAPSGVFVGMGSFGVFLGRYISSFLPSLSFLPSILILTSLALLLFIPLDNGEKEASGFDCASDSSKGVVVLLVIVTVIARSYIGYSIPTFWVKSQWQLFLLFAAMGVGKIAGGFLADCFGARRTAVVSLLAALPFLLFGENLIVISLIGVTLFSMTMSISLAILVSLFPDMLGFSFGITTVALFAGSLPSFFIRPSSYNAQCIVVTALTAVAVLAFAFSSKNQKTNISGKRSKV